MSDFNRNIATTPYGQTVERGATVAVDQGLRAYMLGIYNYMVIGLAITGLAALGIYMVSVTTDPAEAMRSATGAAYALRGGLFLKPIGYYIFVSPLKWAI